MSATRPGDAGRVGLAMPVRITGDAAAMDGAMAETAPVKASRQS